MNIKGKDISFRESVPVGRVIVTVDGKDVYSDTEYRGSAEWAQKAYHLTDGELMALYYDYKEDYDSI